MVLTTPATVLSVVLTGGELLAGAVAAAAVALLLMVRCELRQRREAEAEYRSLAEAAPIGIFRLDEHGDCVYANARFTALTGVPAVQGQALGSRWLAAIHPDDRDEALRTWSATLAARRPGGGEFRIVQPAGTVRWVRSFGEPRYDRRGRFAGYLGTLEDITEQRGYEQDLRELADRDPLTGLLNRRAFERTLEEHLVCTVCRGALLVMDLDGFKFVNDSLGHAKGDELIASIAATLRAALRQSDVVARLGGDEFAVLLPDQDTAGATRVAQHLVEVVRARPVSDGRRVTISIGVATFAGGDGAADELLVRADLAMYDAKEAGRDRVAVYGTAEHPASSVEAQMTWLERVTSALAHDRFVLHAQPIVDLATGDVIRHEVLVRMLSPDGDLIPPASFLGVAERYGLAPALDRWVLEHALDAMASAASAGRRLPLAVNVSGPSTCDGQILELVAERLERHRIAATDLTIELTETAAVGDISRARAFAEALRGLGCRMALDDFGAGYGSLTYLKHLPFDIVKLDGAYVRHAARNATDERIVAAVATLARDLGKETVAEFVPDAETIALLVDLGVDHGQGYHLGRPAPLDDLVAAAQATPVP